jgi:hypothetical protein
VLLGGQLVAVVSGGQEGCYTPAVLTRTDAHADWIAAVLSGQDAGACPTCVPPDPSCTAATETRPAGAVDAGDDASSPDGSPEASTGGSGHHGGGCGLGDAPGRGSPGVVALVVALVLRRRSRQNA